MTKEQLAEMLNGREYGDEISREEERDAKASGLVVVFGYSDDNAEFRGAIHDEVGCYDGGSFMVHRGGILPEWDDVMDSKEDAKEYLVDEKKAVEVKADWNCGGYSWTYRTDIPHATFDIMEDGEKFCRGIVFSINDLPA